MEMLVEHSHTSLRNGAKLVLSGFSLHPPLLGHPPCPRLSRQSFSWGESASPRNGLIPNRVGWRPVSSCTAVPFSRCAGQCPRLKFNILSIQMTIVRKIRTTHGQSRTSWSCSEFPLTWESLRRPVPNDGLLVPPWTCILPL